MHRPLTLVIIFAALASTACTKVYYETWEALGKEKRELLRDNVEELRDDQREVGEELQDALARLKAMYGSDGSQLEKVYDGLHTDFESAKSKASALHERVERVETIADDLFAEWETEITQLKNARYKADSRRKLDDTKSKFAALRASMRKTEKSLEPVMATFQDQVLYLKHNLNARALGTLKGEVAAIEREINALIGDMQRSIAQSDAFIGSLDTAVAH